LQEIHIHVLIKTLKDKSIKDIKIDLSDAFGLTNKHIKNGSWWNDKYINTPKDFYGFVNYLICKNKHIYEVLNWKTFPPMVDYFNIKVETDVSLLALESGPLSQTIKNKIKPLKEKPIKLSKKEIKKLLDEGKTQDEILDLSRMHDHPKQYMKILESDDLTIYF